MRSKYGNAIKPVCLSLICSGCALWVPQTYVEPKEVTLPKAMADVACALKTLQNENARLDLNTGQLIDQVEVTFNVKASATGDSTLVVNAKPAVPTSLFASLGLDYTDKTELVGERGNQVKVTLKNIYTAGLNKPGQAAATRANFGFGMGSRVYYPQDDPCNPRPLTPEDMKHAVGINDPVRKGKS